MVFSCIADLIDPVKDPFPSHYFKKEEDPKVFTSKKTNRGPLAEDWLDDYEKDATMQPIMCAYKLITVEFRYWGIQVHTEIFRLYSFISIISCTPFCVIPFLSLPLMSCYCCHFGPSPFCLQL